MKPVGSIRVFLRLIVDLGLTGWWPGRSAHGQSLCHRYVMRFRHPPAERPGHLSNTGNETEMRPGHGRFFVTPRMMDAGVASPKAAVMA